MEKKRRNNNNKIFKRLKNFKKFKKLKRLKRGLVQKKKLVTAYVHTTLNNTIITITNKEGKVIGWSSVGSIGFKKAKRSSPYGASLAGFNIGKKLLKKGIKSIKVIAKGYGRGKQAAIRGLNNSGLRLKKLEAIKAIAHNGCRGVKKRRL